MKGVNRKPGDPNYDLFQLALKSTSLRLYPNYANCDWSNAAGYDPANPETYFSTMGCRTANLADINADDPKLVQLKDGRGNICPVTIILPVLAMQAKEKCYKMFQKYCMSPSISAASTDDKTKDVVKEVVCEDREFKDTVVDEFMKLLDKKIGEARDMLLERFDWICS